MKKINVLLFRSFRGSFLATFLIAVFVFLMIFIFVYIDEFVGKDIGLLHFIQLFSYFALNTVPRALPLALLLSGIMCIGTLTEFFELSALQSAGISFYKILRPLILFCAAAAIILFFFTNEVLTQSNLKLQTLLMSIRSSKPSLLFKPGAFNNEMSGYSIRIGAFGKEKNSLEEVLVYDHTDQLGNNVVITAQSGNLIQEPNNLLILELENGSIYKEGGAEATKNKELIRQNFESYRLLFNLSEFALKKMNEGNYRSDYSMLNASELLNYVDTLKLRNEELKIGTLADRITRIQVNQSNILRYQLEWHKRYATALSCLLLFLLGAPIGFLLRKGGLGTPLVIASVLYILYHVISITGEKLAEEETISPWLGAWLSTIVVVPTIIWLFRKATRPA